MIANYSSDRDWSRPTCTFYTRYQDSVKNTNDENGERQSIVLVDNVVIKLLC